MTDETAAAGVTAGEAQTTTPVETQPVEIKAETQETPAEAPVETKAEPEVKPEDGEADTGQDDKPKRLSGSQRMKRQREALLAENNELQRRIDELSKPKDTSEKAPEEKDFPGDYLAYERARSAWETRQAVRDEFRRRETVEAEYKQREIRREIADAHAERVEEARDVITDYDATMAQMKGVNVRQDVIDEIMESDKSALLAYHLAKNPERLRALNAMSGKELAREIGRLEGSVRMPAANKQTKAPPPPTQVKGGSSPVRSLHDMSMEEYKKYRKAQDAA